MIQTQTEIRDTTVIVILSGKYDISEILRFEALFKELLKEMPERIALNLNELEYIDSSGIGSLIRCMNFASHESVPFVCYDLNEKLYNLFKAAKLDQYMPLLTIHEFNALFNDAH